MKTSKKELLAEKEATLKSQLANLKGTTIPDFPTQFAIITRAKTSTVSGLEYSINTLENAIRKQEHKNAVKKYWKENEDKYNKLILERENLYQEHRNLLAYGLNEAIRIFKSIDLYVGRFGIDYAEIGVLDETKGEYTGGQAILKFGHSFDICYRNEFFNPKEYSLEMNYPCLGSFNLENDKTRIQYLKGMGEFAGNENLKNEVKNLFEKLRLKSDEIKTNVGLIDAQIENPF